jgi:hypothetical protein
MSPRRASRKRSARPVEHRAKGHAFKTLRAGGETEIRHCLRKATYSRTVSGLEISNGMNDELSLNCTAW